MSESELRLLCSLCLPYLNPSCDGENVRKKCCLFEGLFLPPYFLTQPDLDVDMVSAEAAEVVAQSLHDMDDIEEKMSNTDELLNMVSYEDVEFNAEDAKIPAPLDTTSFIPTDEVSWTLTVFLFLCLI